MSELSLDDVQRHALAGELYSVRMAQLMWREPSPHACFGGVAAKLAADRGS